MYYSIRRYWIAWLYKYSRPGMKPLEAQTVGQYGYPGNFNLSGSGIAQVNFCLLYLKKYFLKNLQSIFISGHFRNGPSFPACHLQR